MKVLRTAGRKARLAERIWSKSCKFTLGTNLQSVKEMEHEYSRTVFLFRKFLMFLGEELWAGAARAKEFLQITSPPSGAPVFKKLFFFLNCSQSLSCQHFSVLVGKRPPRPQESEKFSSCSEEGRSGPESGSAGGAGLRRGSWEVYLLQSWTWWNELALHVVSELLVVLGDFLWDYTGSNENHLESSGR